MKKITRYFFTFVCFIVLLTIGEGCKNVSLTNSNLSSEKSEIVVTENVGEDSFDVTQSLAVPQLDIVIVLDTSNSMNHHQQKLAESFGNLVAGLSTSELLIDWQMVFINADDSFPVVADDGYHGTFYYLENEDGEIEVDGEKVSILTADLSDDSDYLQEVFSNTINRGGKGARVDEKGNPAEDSGVEVPLRNIANAIDKRNSENSGFFRDSATLVTIILSNEDELSDGQPKTGHDEEGQPYEVYPTTPSEVLQAVSDAFGTDKRFVSYGIIVQEDDQECINQEINQSQTASPIYGEFIDELSAKTYDICEGDYSGILIDIGSHLEASLTLSSIPFRYNNVIEDSITLTFTPAENEQSGTFDASSNTYIFDEKPANETTITVEYEYYVSENE